MFKVENFTSQVHFEFLMEKKYKNLELRGFDEIFYTIIIKVEHLSSERNVNS